MNVFNVVCQLCDGIEDQNQSTQNSSYPHILSHSHICNVKVYGARILQAAAHSEGNREFILWPILEFRLPSLLWQNVADMRVILSVGNLFFQKNFVFFTLIKINFVLFKFQLIKILVNLPKVPEFVAFYLCLLTPPRHEPRCLTFWFRETQGALQLCLELWEFRCYNNAGIQLTSQRGISSSSWYPSNFPYIFKYILSTIVIMIYWPKNCVYVWLDFTFKHIP